MKRCTFIKYYINQNDMKTLKVLIINFLMLLPGLNLDAQNIHYGLLAGVGVNHPCVGKHSYDNQQLFYNMPCFNVNGQVEYRFPGLLGLAAEPGYIRKGGAVDGINRIMTEFKIKLHYFQLPILANVYFTDKFYLSIGPEFAYLMSNDVNLSHKLSAFTPFEENALEISGLFGVNYNITKRIDIGLRYSHALTHFAVVSWTNIYDDILGQAKVYNQYFQLTCRYKINTVADK